VCVCVCGRSYGIFVSNKYRRNWSEKRRDASRDTTTKTSRSTQSGRHHPSSPPTSPSSPASLQPMPSSRFGRANWFKWFITGGMAAGRVGLVGRTVRSSFVVVWGYCRSLACSFDHVRATSQHASQTDRGCSEIASSSSSKNSKTRTSRYIHHICPCGNFTQS